MSKIREDTTPVEAQRVLRDHIDIDQLLGRYFLAVDQRAFDEEWVRSVFTEDARLEFPVATHVGIAGIADVHHTALGRFQQTQHVTSPAVIDVDGVRARARANVIMTHIHLATTQAQRGDTAPFVVGGLFDGELVRTADGWRFSLLVCEMLWTTGRPPLGVGPEP